MRRWFGVVALLAWCGYLIGATIYENRACGWPRGIWQDAACKSPGKARPMLNLGKVYLDRGEADNAFFAFLQAESLALQDGYRFDPQSAAMARINRAVILMRQGKLAEAHDLFVSVLDQFQPEEPLALNGLVYIYLESGYPEDAMAVSDQLFGRHSDWVKTNAAANVHRARTLVTLGLCDLARVHFDAARIIDPSLPAFTCN